MPFPQGKSFAAVAEPTCGPVTFPGHREQRRSLARIPARGRRNTPRNTLTTPSRNIRRPTAAGRSRNSSRPPRKTTFRLSWRSHCQTRWLPAHTGTQRRARPPGGPDLYAHDEPDAPAGATPDIQENGEPAAARDNAADAWGEDEPAVPSGGPPDAFGRSGLSSPDRGSPGFYGRGETKDSRNDLSGDAADTPVSGFHALIRLPSPPAAGQPSPPGERVERASRPPWTTPPAEERIAPPGEWHIPSRPAATASGATASGATAAAGRRRRRPRQHS